MQTKSEREILIYARFVIKATQRRHQPDTTHNTIESIELSRFVRGGKQKGKNVVSKRAMRLFGVLVPASHKCNLM